MYKKHNSFVGIRGNHADEKKVLDRLQRLRDKKKLIESWDDSKKEVLSKAYSCLLDSSDQNKISFHLTPHVIEEIKLLSDNEISKYLFHRYRYEVFPQTQTLDDYPPYLQIEIASLCNFRCVFCYQTDKSFTKKSNGHMGYMSLDFFKKVIDESEGNIEFISIASRGEPTLCPDFSEMMRYTQGKFLNLKLNTNASLLDEEKCHAILQSGVRTVVFSADAAQEPLYSQLRVGGDLNKVLKNVERFQKIRKAQYGNSKIITRVSGVKFDEKQNLDDMEKFWGDLVDQVAFVNYNPWENTYERPVNDIQTPCSDLWRRMFIWYDGRVNPCDVDYKTDLEVGKMPKESLSKVWNSDFYQKLRLLHQNGHRQDAQPCNRCTVI